jgi:uncharacterized membrane protein
MFKRLVRYFLQGLLYVAPLAVTVYVIAFAIIRTDGLLMDREFFHRGVLAKYNFPGLGLVVILTLVTVVGFIGQKMISSPLSEAYDKLMKKAPLIKMIYTSVKDLLSAFVGGEKKFSQPVIVKLMVAVYLPSSYGMLGELYVVSHKQIKPIDANSADVMKFIVSGGISKIKN